MIIKWCNDQQTASNIRSYIPSTSALYPFLCTCRVIPDEGDVEKALGEGVFRSSFYVAQENLEAIELTPTPTRSTFKSTSTTTSTTASQASTQSASSTSTPSTSTPSTTTPEHNHDLLINHRHLSFYFPHFDLAKGRFQVPHKLLFCFPPQAPQSQSQSQAQAQAQAQAETHDESSSSSLTLALSLCERAMLEMYFTLKASLARTNTMQAQSQSQSQSQSQPQVKDNTPSFSAYASNRCHTLNLPTYIPSYASTYHCPLSLLPPL